MLRVFGLLVFILIMTSCGYMKPMYEQYDDVRSGLVLPHVDVKVAAAENYTAYVFRREMERLFAFHQPLQQDDDHVYSLEIKVLPNIRAAGIQRSGEALSTVVTVTVSYTISYNGNIIKQGAVDDIVSNSIASEFYTSTVAEERQRLDSVRSMANQVFDIVAITIKNHQGSLDN